MRCAFLAVLAALMLCAACDKSRPARYTLGAEFAAFYENHGGARVFGPPLSDVRDESGLRVQYVENARLEYHPNAMPGRRVRLSPLLALRSRLPDPPVGTPAPAEAVVAYYAATGHTVRDQFLSFYETYGGPSVFGYPLTEVIIEDGRQVQYFEYAILYWDETAPPGERVRLAPLGAMALDPARSWWRDAEPRTFEGGVTIKGLFREFYETYGDEAVFGRPLANAVVDAQGSTVQVFENVCIALDDTSGGPRVHLWPLGAALAPTGQPTPAAQEGRCFPQTGYCLTSDFRAFFDAHGGEAVFGPPVSPVIAGPENGVPVQYLERARLEWDAVSGRVNLTPLGRWLVEGRIPGFAPPGATP